MGFFTGRETEDGYEPSMLHRWLMPELSGNTINGLGETTVRRPTLVYHRMEAPHPWRKVNMLFGLRVMTRPGLLLRVFSSKAISKATRQSPVAPKKKNLTPEMAAAKVKELGFSLGADKIGICEIRPEWVLEGEEVTEKYAIIVASRMNYYGMRHAIEGDFLGSVKEVMDIYIQGQRRVTQMASWIQEQGWAARGYGNSDSTPMLIIPHAIEAGLGELGKHGSLINKELGAMFRLAYIVTDMPMAIDEPIDDGVDEFCLSCQKCTVECPPNAISDQKQMVRGVEKWYVDFDKCIPYFNDKFACGVCMTVCPWSLPGAGLNISKKMLKRRTKQQYDTGRQAGNDDQATRADDGHGRSDADYGRVA